MATPTIYARRFLQAKPEAQAALIGTVNALNVTGIVDLDGVELAAINLTLVTWMALAAKVAYGRDLAALATAPETQPK